MLQLFPYMPNNHISFLRALFEEGGSTHRKIFHSLKAKADARRTTMEKLADKMTAIFGSNIFLWLNVVFFTLWLLVNTNKISFFSPFDPFPFNLLTNVVSLEAIFLAIFVLISQNRTAKIDDLREETNLQLSVISELEVTKIMKMLALLLDKQGIDLSQDPELQKMIRPVSEEEIERKLEKEIL